MEVTEYEKMYCIEEENWWYVGRRELLLGIIDEIKTKSGINRLQILDVGCGTGVNLNYLGKYGDVFGLDFSGEALRFAKLRGNAPLIRASADHLPLRTNSIDVLCAFDVIEHIDDDKAALREFYRVLKGGGHLILTVPAFKFLWSAHDVAVHHKRRYGREELANSLSSCRFSIQQLTYWNFILFPLVALVRVFKRNRVGDPTTDLREGSFLINKILLYILRVETVIIKKVAPPFGVSILSISEKDQYIDESIEAY